jgi:antitoxin (DNA-binding transcriptional repressor) of toxin-antitoxin stability system
MTDQEMEMPAGSPVLGQLVDAVANGTVTYLTQEGRRVAAVVPADLAESIVPARPTDGDDDLVLSAAESRRRLEQLRREQGVQPIKDPADLRGPGMPEEEARAFSEAATSGWVRRTT